MVVQRRQYTLEFKREAVRLISEGGVSVARAAQDLGVCRVRASHSSRGTDAGRHCG